MKAKKAGATARPGKAEPRTVRLWIGEDTRLAMYRFKKAAGFGTFCEAAHLLLGYATSEGSLTPEVPGCPPDQAAALCEAARETMWHRMDLPLPAVLARRMDELGRGLGLSRSAAVGLALSWTAPRALAALRTHASEDADATDGEGWKGGVA